MTFMNINIEIQPFCQLEHSCSVFEEIINIQKMEPIKKAKTEESSEQ